MAIKLKPKLAKPYSNRGVAHFHMGETELALKDYNKAIELDPEDGETYYNRSEVWLRWSEWDRAREDLRIAKGKGVNIVEAFQKEFKSVEGFENRYKVKLSQDLATIPDKQMSHQGA